MGLISSRRTSGSEEAEISTANPYRYPPRSGNYFGNYYIMGGERFETNQQDTYLFGENDDLNFLGSKPVPFPYPAPQAHEPTKTLKSLVNIRRDSLRFMRDVDGNLHGKVDGDKNVEQSSTRYNIEFTFDSDVKCAITIYYFATEELINRQAVYRPRDANMNSETFHYKRGANQTFSQSLHVIDPTQFPEEDWQYNIDKEVIPIVIQCVVEEDELLTHSHVTYAVVDKSCDGTYTVKCLKQKQFVDGVGYLLQEIYGIENKNTDRAKDDDVDDNGSECVICMCEMRDTLILPCRHLCLCNGCADNLRYQANNCPICRAKFYALLQIRAMRRKVPLIGTGTTSGVGGVSRHTDCSDEMPLSQEGVPPGYEAVSLIEALNGPTLPHCALHASIVTTDGTLRSLLSSDAPPKDDASGDVVTTPAGDTDDSKHGSNTSFTEAVHNSDGDGTELPSSRRLSDDQPYFYPSKKSTLDSAVTKDDQVVSRTPLDSLSATSSSQTDTANICVGQLSAHSSVEVVSELSTDSDSVHSMDRGCRLQISAPGASDDIASKTEVKPVSGGVDRTDIARTNAVLVTWRDSADRSSDSSSSSSKGLISDSAEMAK